MMKQEFEQRIGAEVTQEQYRMIEHVYMWHPSIPNVGGKDVIAQLWKIGGMALIEDMDDRCVALEMDYQNVCDELRKVIVRKGDVLQRIGELQKEIESLNTEFDVLTAETERLSMLKEQLNRG